VMLLIHAIALTALLVGSYTDLKKREVADWVNYGLIAAGLGVNALLSIAFWDWRFLAYSIAGFLVFLGIALIMFYTGQWGGGDSKMLMGLGALIGLPVFGSLPFVSLTSFMVSLWVNMLLVGVVYALLWSVVAAIRHRTAFRRALRKRLAGNKVMRRWMLGMTGAGLAASFLVPPLLQVMIVIVVLLAPLTFYLSQFSKAVEQAAMLKLVSPLKLTEGDWLARDVRVAGKRIAGPKDLGVSKKQISLLVSLYRKRKVRSVLIKEGIPFIPSFLAAYVLTYFFGNLFFSLL
jgi:Flp pilus assembly protein protease CpaA